MQKSVQGAKRITLSLDQTFLWNFHTKGHANAQRLFALVETAVKTGQAACPVHSNELVEEGSKAPAEKRTGLLQIAASLSAGLAFRDITWSIADETLQLVRPNYAPQRLLPGMLAVPEDLDGHGARMREAIKDYDTRLRQTPYPPPSFAPGMDSEAIYQEIMKQRRESMLRLVTALRDGTSFKTGFNEREFTLGAALRLRMIGIGSEECDLLMTLISQRKWEKNPTLFWHSRLCAQLEFEQLRSKRKTDPNDHFDLSRLAVGLTDADVVLCDESMSNLIKKTGLNAPPHFCWKTSGEAIRHLETLFQN
jgi:hypothetical protein